MRIVLDETFDHDELIWRYFTTDRLLEFMISGELYFASAREFQDPFEGAVAVIPPEFSVDTRYSELEEHELAFEELRRLIKINCWHRAPY